MTDHEWHLLTHAVAKTNHVEGDTIDLLYCEALRARNEAARLQSIANERGERLVALTEEAGCSKQKAHAASAEAARLRVLLERVWEKEFAFSAQFYLCLRCNVGGGHAANCIAGNLHAALALPSEPRTLTGEEMREKMVARLNARIEDVEETARKMPEHARPALREYAQTLRDAARIILAPDAPVTSEWAGLPLSRPLDEGER